MQRFPDGVTREALGPVRVGRCSSPGDPQAVPWRWWRPQSRSQPSARWFSDSGPASRAPRTSASRCRCRSRRVRWREVPRRPDRLRPCRMPATSAERYSDRQVEAIPPDDRERGAGVRRVEVAFQAYDDSIGRRPLGAEDVQVETRQARRARHAAASSDLRLRYAELDPVGESRKVAMISGPATHHRLPDPAQAVADAACPTSLYPARPSQAFARGTIPNAFPGAALARLADEVGVPARISSTPPTMPPAPVRRKTSAPSGTRPFTSRWPDHDLECRHRHDYHDLFKHVDRHGANGVRTTADKRNSPRLIAGEASSPNQRVPLVRFDGFSRTMDEAAAAPACTRVPQGAADCRRGCRLVDATGFPASTARR